jgi:hypothetical protein
MMKWNGFATKSKWPNPGSNPTFSWRGWVKRRESSGMVTGAPEKTDRQPPVCKSTTLPLHQTARYHTDSQWANPEISQFREYLRTYSKRFIYISWEIVTAVTGRFNSKFGQEWSYSRNRVISRHITPIQNHKILSSLGNVFKKLQMFVNGSNKTTLNLLWWRT